MNVDAYLRRIGYRGSREPAIGTLRDLHHAHMLSVPFENLDIHLGRKIVLEEALLYAKIVCRRRGGFCYELNGLFAALLREMGYDVQRLSASVARSDGAFGPPFDHMALLVQLEERWLVDVGFGASFREPLRLDERGEQIQADEWSRIDDGGEYLIYSRYQDGEWKAQYRFTLQPYALADFAGCCHFHQTSPESSFTRRRICTRATEEGRVTLSDMRFVASHNGSRAERILQTDADYRYALYEHFGVAL